jgi:hypothetical protein
MLSRKDFLALVSHYLGDQQESKNKKEYKDLSEGEEVLVANLL